MDSFHHRGRMPAAPARLPQTVDLDGLPDELPWALSYRPGLGYMVGIHHARDGLLDGGSHPTPQAAVAEALLFARAHRLFAGADGAMPDPECDGGETGRPVPADYGPLLGMALRLVLAGLLVAALFWQFAA